MQRLNATSDMSVLVNAFDSDREATMAAIYRTYREGFLRYGRQMSNDEELNIDCFQDAVISLYENLSMGRVADLKSTVKTYLFAIGKHKILNARRKHQNQMKHAVEHVDFEEPQGDHEEAIFRKELLSKAFDELGEKCREILMKFYYQRYSIDAILIDMNYKNENTVKAHKSRCLSKLREIVLSSKEV